MVEATYFGGFTMKESFTLAPIFSDYMMFQANRPITIFGKCKKGIELTIRFLDQVVKIKTKNDQFSIDLQACPPQKQGFSFSVSTKKEEVVFYNCLIGDIYLVAGGRNIDFKLKESYNISVSEQNQIRFYNQSKRPFPEAHLRYPEHYLPDENWKICTKENADDFSAIGYFLAMKLHENTRTPIGIISISYPNTPILSWIGYHEIIEKEKLCREIKDYQATMMSYQEDKDYVKEFEFAIANYTPIPMGMYHPARPSGIYNSMVLPFEQVKIKGMLFYSGESDHGLEGCYEMGLNTLVDNYRRLFKDEELPFVFVQTSGYVATTNAVLNTVLLREEQRKAMSPSKHIYMVSAIDLGEEVSLVPKEKSIISERIANVFLDKVYKIGKNSLSPMLFSYQVTKGKCHIFTEHNHLNLVSRSNKNKQIMLSTDGSTFYEAKKVEIQNNQIIISDIKNVKWIRYAYQEFPICEYYSTNELPLLPFLIRIDV